MTMTKQSLQLNSRKLKVFATCVALTLSAACTKGGGTLTAESSTGGGGISGTVAFGAIYPTSIGSSWTPIVVSTRSYLRGLSITYTGTCSLGIDTIKMNEGGPDYPETAACQVDGSWSLTKVYTATTGEGDKTIHLTAYDVDGNAVTGGTASKLVRVDLTVPATITLTGPTPLAEPYQYNGGVANIDISGTCADDVDHITLSYSGNPSNPTTIVPAGVGTAGCNFTTNVPVVPGTSRLFNFYTWDAAGNQSSAVPQTIAYSPSVNILSGNFSGGLISDNNASGMKAEFSSRSETQGAIDSFSSMVLQTGFNGIINKERERQ